MNQPRSREEEIFETIVSLPAEQRAAVIKLACGDDVRCARPGESNFRNSKP